MPTWLATAAGSGFCFLVAGQSWSRFEQRWDVRGAKTIWNNTKAKLPFGATSDPDDTETMSKLCGEIALPYWETSVVASGKPLRTRRWEMVPVRPPEEARMLCTWRALAVRRNATPTIVRIWRRADYKRWRRRDSRIPLSRLGGPSGLPPAAPPPDQGGGQWSTSPIRPAGRPSRPWHAPPRNPGP